MWQAGRSAELRLLQVAGFQAGSQRNGQTVFSLVRESKKESSELNERRTNVYENKGPVWKTFPQGANVYENKCS
jgi:hypothetical protein